MNKYQLSEALGNVSDDLLLEAVQVQRKRTPWLRVAAAAAVVALIMTWLLWPVEDENFVTGPGLLTIRAYAVEAIDEEIIEEVVLEEGVIFSPRASVHPGISFRRQIPFSFSVDKSLYSDMNLTLEVTTDAGIFYNNDPLEPPFSAPSTPDDVLTLSRYYGQHFTVDIDKIIYWEPWGFDYAYWLEQTAQGMHDHESTYKPHLFERNPSFIDVIIRAGDFIIGYCVIEIREINGATGSKAQDFSFEVLTIVSFPQVDGQWQDVTYKYVQEKINTIHSERTGG